MRKFKCMDCEKRPEAPQFREELWKSLGLGEKDLLCINCFELRLGRDICLLDLEDCVLTTMIKELITRAKEGRL